MASKTYTSNYPSNAINSRGAFPGSHPYSSADISPYPGPYIFKERSGRLKWKEMMKLDLEGMIRDNDISPLENYLENLIFSSIDETDLQIVPETSFLKLVKINQYIMEFLLDTQQRLEYENKSLESNYNTLVTESIHKESVLKENKSLINALKKDKREKEMVLNTYKCLIDEYKQNAVNLAPNKTDDSIAKSKKYFYCQYCEGKKFSSEDNLESHLRRRHASVKPSQSVDSFQPNTNLEEKFDQIKNFFETYVKNFHSESFGKIYEHQKNLENKLSEIKSEKGNDIKEMENTFKSTLIEMKEIYLKNSMMNANNMMGNSYLGVTPMVTDKSRKDSDDDSEKANKKLKKQTKKMNEMLKDMGKEQNEKIGKLMEQFMQFKNSLAEEFKEIKTKSNITPVINNEVSEKLDLQTKNTKGINNLQYSTVVSKAESIQINRDDQVTTNLNSHRHVELVKEAIIQKTIHNKKVLFNSGRLESDDEDFDALVDQVKFKNASVNLEKNHNNMDPKFSFAPEASISLKNSDVVSPFQKSEENKIDKIEKVEENIASSIVITKEDVIKLPKSKIPENASLVKEEVVKVEAAINTLPSIETEDKLPMEKALSIGNLNKEKSSVIEKQVENEVKAEEKSHLYKEERILPIEKLNIEKIKEEERIKEVEEKLKKMNQLNQLKEEEKIKNKENIEKFYHYFVQRDNRAIEKPKLELCVEKIM
jgi:hypothetical protein